MKRAQVTDPRIIILFVAWLAASAYVFSNGVYALRDPEKWLDASWTATRGFRRERPLSADDLAKISTFGAQCLVMGSIFGLIIIVLIGEVVIAYLR
jgi:hypothetical protein